MRQPARNPVAVLVAVVAVPVTAVMLLVARDLVDGGPTWALGLALTSVLATVAAAGTALRTATSQARARSADPFRVSREAEAAAREVGWLLNELPDLNYPPTSTESSHTDRQSWLELVRTRLQQLERALDRLDDAELRLLEAGEAEAAAKYRRLRHEGEDIYNRGRSLGLIERA